MSRTKGARAKAYPERRLELAGRLRFRLARAGGKRPSFAELAAAAGVSLATLRHYFRDRDGVVGAVLSIHAAMGDEHLAVLSQPSGGFRESVVGAAAQIVAGLQEPIVAELHALGLAEGFDHPTSGPAYLRDILEPLIQAFEKRLAVHIERGEMRAADTRTAAIGLIGPLVLVHLHQDWLGGTEVRPLDQTAHLHAQVDAFVRSYAVASSSG